MQSDHNYKNDYEVFEQVERSSSQNQKDEVATYKILSFRSIAPEQYKSLVFATWLNSLRYGNEVYKHISQDSYYKIYSKYIDNLLKRPMSRLRIAVLSEDEDVTFGWSVDEGDVLHYVFVKKDFRQNGIGTQLVSKDIKTFSHLTKIGLSIWKEKYPEIEFNPFS